MTVERRIGGDVRQETVMRKACGRKLGNHGSKVILLRGWNHHYSLSPHTSISSLTIQRLTHQTPEALNYRTGPHPGCPFK